MFDQSEYTIAENRGSVVLTVDIPAVTLATSLSVQVRIIPQTALGELSKRLALPLQ